MDLMIFVIIMINSTNTVRMIELINKSTRIEFDGFLCVMALCE